MSNLLSSLKTDDSIQNEQDRLGGGSYILESGVYNCKINHAYIQTAGSGALGLNLSLQTENGQEIRQVFWMTSGDAKGRLNYFVNQKGEKQYLPGFTLAESLSLLSVGKPISELETENKLVKAWDSTAKAEVPTQVPMLMDLLGQEITVGLVKVKSFKQTRLDDGHYVETDEERETNEIEKFFRASDGKTTAEIRAKSDEAQFIHKWKEKWEGQVKDLTQRKGNTPVAKATPTAKPQAKPSASLFN